MNELSVLFRNDQQKEFSNDLDMTKSKLIANQMLTPIYIFVVNFCSSLFKGIPLN